MGWNFTNHNQLWIWSYESYLSVTVMAHLTILSINLKCNSFWLRKLDITKITVENIFRPRFVFLQWRANCCSKKQIWQFWLTCPNEMYKKTQNIRIPVQLLAEIGTGWFANSRGAIHTSSANAITEIVILTSTFLNFSF